MLSLLIFLTTAAFAQENCEPRACESRVPSWMKVESSPPFTRVLGAAGVPNCTRVVRIDESKTNPLIKVLYQDAGKVKEALIPKDKFMDPADQCTSRDDLASFIREAKFQLKISRENPHLDRVPNFKQLISNLEDKLSCIDQKQATITDQQWEQFQSSENLKLSPKQKNKVELIDTYQKLIFKTLDSDGSKRKLSEHSLIVPISMEWIRSSPELNQYFKEKWITPGNLDLRILGGNSGEGIQGEDKNLYLQKLVDLRTAIEHMKNKDLIRSPEYHWLTRIDSTFAERFDRMIFIHEYTWNSHSTGWQDFIPVDQSFGSIHSNPILSVLIHELNVNSGTENFLPEDTHSMMKESQKIWGCIDHGLSLEQVNRNPTSQFQALGLRPELGVVYLGILLPDLASALGCDLK